MNLTHNKRAVGIFSGYEEAENALNKLQYSGFAMDKVSIVFKENNRSKINHVDEEAKARAMAGVAVGGLTGLLVGMGILAIPGVGSILLAGKTATAIASTLAGGAIGSLTGGLVGSLVGLGISEEQAQVYHNHLTRGNYLVIVDGTEAEIRGAGKILRRRGIQDWEVYPTEIIKQEIDPSYSLMKL